MPESGANNPEHPASERRYVNEAQLSRELNLIKEVLMAELRGQDKETKATLTGMDRAIKLLQSQTDRVPSETDIKVGGLRDHCEAQFKGIDTRFNSVDTRFHDVAAREAERAASLRGEVKTAFENAKESTSKAETNSTNQLNSLRTEFSDYKDSQRREMTELRESVIRNASRNEGSGIAVSWIISGIMVFLAIVGALVAFAARSAPVVVKP